MTTNTSRSTVTLSVIMICTLMIPNAVYAIFRVDESYQQKQQRGKTTKQLKHSHLAHMLRCAARDGDTNRVQQLLAKKVDVNCPDKAGRTALMFASSLGQTAVVKQLLDADATVNHQDRQGFTALSFAAAPVYLPSVEDIQKLSAWRAHVPTEAYLLRLDYELGGYDGNGQKEKSLETAYGDIIALLLAAGADPDKGAVGLTPLWLASWWGNVAIMRQLLQAGARIDVWDKVGYNPLIIAAKMGHQKAVSLLLGAGVHVRHISRALIHAVEFGYAEIARILCAFDIDPRQQNARQETALLLAASRGYSEVVSRLIAMGADVNQQNGEKETAILKASQEGHTAVVSQLIEAGADVNIADINGNTALAHAINWNHAEIARLLLKAGANAEFDPVCGKSLYVLALEHNLTVIAELLKDAGCKDVMFLQIAHDGLSDQQIIAAIHNQNNRDPFSETYLLNPQKLYEVAVISREPLVVVHLVTVCGLVQKAISMKERPINPVTKRSFRIPFCNAVLKLLGRITGMPDYTDAQFERLLALYKNK